MTGAIITAVGGVFAAVFTTLVGWFVLRTDKASKMTQSAIKDQQYIFQLVGVLRDDVWAQLDWGQFARSRYAEARERLLALGVHVDKLPEMPSMRHREIEERHARGESTDDDEK